MNFFDRMYCEECQSDIDRIEHGYHAVNPPCKNFTCKGLDLIELIVFIPVFVILTIILIPVLIFFMIFNTLYNV